MGTERAIKLLITYEGAHKCTFQAVIIFRGDVLLWNDIYLPRYDLSRVYVNGHAHGNGDFHAVMSSELAHRFGTIHDYYMRTRPARWGWQRAFVSNVVTPGLEPVDDAIRPCESEEVYRREKLNRCFQKQPGLCRSLSQKYGSPREWCSIDEGLAGNETARKLKWEKSESG